MSQITSTPERTISVVAEPINEDQSWRYHPDKIHNLYDGRPWLVFQRLVSIIWNFGWFFIHLWLDKVGSSSIAKQEKRAEEMKGILTKLGPTYIKIGQALSTRPDLVSPIYLKALTTLQDDIPSFPNEVAFKFIEEELGPTGGNFCRAIP